jgi:hypothetical protein
MLPFSNAVFIYRVTGQELLDVLQISANALTATELEHFTQTALSLRSFLQVSGLRLEISKGGTMLSVKIEKECCLEPVDAYTTYYAH